MAHEASPVAIAIIQQFAQLSTNRGNWESHWQEIAERILNAHSTNFVNPGSQSTRGERRTTELFDSTGSIALNRFAAILDSLLTPRNQTWHRVLASDSNLNKDRSVMLWFEQLNRIVFKYRYAPLANFSSQNQQQYTSLGAYGTGCMFTDQLAGGPGVRYRNVHLSECYFAENHQGLVDTAFRHFPMTARQMVQKWGMENVPARVLETTKTHPQREFFILHCVKPNTQLDPRRADFRGMPFLAYYVSIEGQVLLDIKGFTSFPYSISRYEQSPGEVYGRSPAMDVLPAIKTLNEQKKTLLKQGHRTVDPVLLTHDDGVADTFSLKPGAINTGGVSREGKLLVQALPVGRVDIGKDLMDDERAVINDAFLVTLFQILIETPTMTATEVMERTREKGILLAPTIGRQQSEYLGPLIEREVDLLVKQGLVPPLPPILLEAEGDYRIEYDSPLSRAQRAEEASGLLRAVEAALNIAGQTGDPAPLDHFNWDVIIPEISAIQGVPTKWLHGADAISRARQARAEQIKLQNQIDAAPGAAALQNAGTKRQQGGR